jgi:hypothetical protein
MQEELASATATELGCRYYTDIHAMLENKEIDAVKAFQIALAATQSAGEKNLIEIPQNQNDF